MAQSRQGHPLSTPNYRAGWGRVGASGPGTAVQLGTLEGEASCKPWVLQGLILSQLRKGVGRGYLWVAPSEAARHPYTR